MLVILFGLSHFSKTPTEAVKITDILWKTLLNSTQAVPQKMLLAFSHKSYKIITQGVVIIVLRN